MMRLMPAYSFNHRSVRPPSALRLRYTRTDVWAFLKSIPRIATVIPHRIVAHAANAEGGQASVKSAAQNAAKRAAMPPIDDKDWSRFRKEVLPHFDAAYNFARYLTRDATAAEDILQSAFVRALSGYAQFRGGDPKAWIFAIIRNCFLSHARSQARGPRLFDPAGAAPSETAERAPDLTPEEAVLEQEDAARMRTLIASLPGQFREVLILREMEEFSYRQIAETIDAPIGTVMSRLARARALLAEAWRAAEEETPA